VYVGEATDTKHLRVGANGVGVALGVDGHRTDRLHVLETGDRQEARTVTLGLTLSQHKGKVKRLTSYIAQYPIIRTAQSTLHFTHW